MVKNNLKKASGLGYFLHSDTFLAVLKIENNFQVIASDIESVWAIEKTGQSSERCV